MPLYNRKHLSKLEVYNYQVVKDKQKAPKTCNHATIPPSIRISAVFSTSSIGGEESSLGLDC